MILTAAGLVAIENIKAGDKVISTNTDTFETAEKTVVETYIREVPQLVHLTINGERISTTVDHPFYVKDVGFVNAGELYVCDVVITTDGDTYSIQNIDREIVDKPVTVYNFQVEDFHTYHVGNLGVLVHNAGKDYRNYDPDDDLPKTEKMGKRHGNTPQSNQAQNADFNYVSKECGLNKSQSRLLHDEITGQGYGKDEIMQIAKDLFGNN